MIVKNKKTGFEYSISAADWKAMKSSGDAVHFNVISREDMELEKPQPIQLQEVTEYIAKAKEQMNKPKKLKSNYKPTKKTTDGQ